MRDLPAIPDEPIIVDLQRPTAIATATAADGRADVQRSAAELAERLPEALAPFAQLAYNYLWSWRPGGSALFEAIDARRFALCGKNPVRLLQEAPTPALRRAAEDAALLAHAHDLLAQVRAELERPPAPAPVDPAHPVAFICAEYGIHPSLPIYSGGLGALAGDLVKEASDEAMPLVAVGLMYRKGYFRQRIDAAGWQHEYWLDTDPERLPAALVTMHEGRPLTVEVPIYDARVSARVWRTDVGRVPLFLLDTDCPENGPLERWITGRLYVADAETRLAQYVLLGVGALRALRAMGIEPGLLHLNEGHAALAPLELAAPALRDGEPLDAALAQARSRTAFTTHTPVPAGNDSYPAELVTRATGALATELGVPVGELLALGRTHPGDEHEGFGVTQTALHLSHAANGVSRRHGEVARQMWNGLWPDRAAAEVPIGHVTNGVHVPTWLGAPMHALFDRHLGESWLAHAADPDVWAAVEQIPDEELWAARSLQREELIAFVRERSTIDRLARGDVREYVQAAERAFDPGVLTIGFARRVATYKRLDLLSRDVDWTLSLLGGERPIQVVLGGKAHPRDEDAKRTLRAVFELKSKALVGERVVFLDDYDLDSAAWLVRGCDVWLNLPRPPLEASGTSGMKSAVNGGLQLSVLDGWWAEACEPGVNGWGLPGEIEFDHQAQDQRDADALHRLLSDEVLPAFYDRDERGLPVRWLALMRASLRTLAPRFSAARMLGEYIQGPYRIREGCGAPRRR
jgi:glycogen phosphorylase